MAGQIILRDLLDNKKNGSVSIYKRIVALFTPSSKSLGLEASDEILVQLLDVVVKADETASEQLLLASHALFSILIWKYKQSELQQLLIQYLSLEVHKLISFKREFDIVDLEMFKLTIIYGFLIINRPEVYTTSDLCQAFQIIEKNCSKYTKYSYFAYKLLLLWLRRSELTNFWRTIDDSFEERLEALIFSNWDNSIKEISQQNSSSVFSMYLKIMSDKYKGFLHFTLERCLESISWENEIKYSIITECFNLSGDINRWLTPHFALQLLCGITKQHLRDSATKVYSSSILRTLNFDELTDSFYEPMKRAIENWKLSRHHHDTLKYFCTQWLEPTVEKHPEILTLFLQESNLLEENEIFHSFLIKLATKKNVRLNEDHLMPEHYSQHRNHFVKLNYLANVCAKGCSSHKELRYLISIHASTSNLHLREGICKQLDAFLKNCSPDVDINGISSSDEWRDDCQFFIYWLYLFICQCYEVGSSYQKKNFALKLHNIVLTRAQECSNNKDRTRRMNFYCNAGLLEESLLRLVKDPAADIRRAAIKIFMLGGYAECSNEYKQELLGKSLDLCNSSKFFDIEAGTSLLSLAINWWKLPEFKTNNYTVDLNDCNSEIDKVAKFIDLLIQIAQEQLPQVKNDVLHSLETNKPFYGVVIAIMEITFKSNIVKCSLSQKHAEQVLDLIEDAVKHFISLLSSNGEQTEYSSSFAQIGVALDDTVKNSFACENDYDEFLMSPAHQLVLSCIWNTLKVSCELASFVGSKMYSEQIVTRCYDLIFQVAVKCRHKGAIESAGVAINNLTTCLCNSPNFHKLPMKYLESLINIDCENKLNITRRGAGISIVFHRIVTGDKRKTRILMHHAVEVLLQLLKDDCDSSMANKEYQFDPPCVMRLHFLRFLVADKEIHAKLMPYLEDIALISFDYLRSNAWSVRNASLQLFGAVVPRIVGQSSGKKTVDFGNGYSVDHFVTHYPVFSKRILSELQGTITSANDKNIIISAHSKIVHLLVLLSRLSVGGCELIDYSSSSYIEAVKVEVKKLLSSPINHVRVLVAKTLAAFVAPLSATCEMQRLKAELKGIDSRNLIHGYLAALLYLRKKSFVQFELTSINDEKDSWKIFSVEREVSSEDPDPFDDVNKDYFCSLESDVSMVARTLDLANERIKSLEGKRPCFIIEKMFFILLGEFSPETGDTTGDERLGDKLLHLVETLRVVSLEIGFSEFFNCLSRHFAAYLNESDSNNGILCQKLFYNLQMDENLVFIKSLGPKFCKEAMIKLVKIISNGEDTLLQPFVSYAVQSKLHVNSKEQFNSNEVFKALCGGNSPESKLCCFVNLIKAAFANDFDSIIKCLFKESTSDDESTRILVARCLLTVTKRIGLNEPLLQQTALILLNDEIEEIELMLGSCDDFNNYHNLLCTTLVNLSMHQDSKLSFLKKLRNEGVLTSCETKSPFYHDIDTRKDETWIINLLLSNLNNSSVKELIEFKWCRDFLDLMGKIQVSKDLSDSTIRQTLYIFISERDYLNIKIKHITGDFIAKECARDNKLRCLCNV